MVEHVVEQEERLPARLVRGAAGGLISGIVFIVITMWFATTMPGGKAEMPLRMISTILKGSDAMMKGTTGVGLGWAIHLILTLAFGVAFALVVPLLRTNGTVALAGTAYGALLYVINFQILARIAFHAFQMANQPFELFAHLVFGTLLAFAFFGTGVRRREHVAVIGTPGHHITAH